LLALATTQWVAGKAASAGFLNKEARGDGQELGGDVGGDESLGDIGWLDGHTGASPF